MSEFVLDNHVTKRPAGLQRLSAAGLGALLAWLLPPTGAGAAELAVTLHEVASDEGHVLVAVCSEKTFLGARCPYTGSAAAAEGLVRVVVRGIEPGAYAVQSFHDANDNLDIDRNFFGLPREGMGFSRDAPMRFGPPRFEDAVVEVTGERSEVEFRMRYFD
jgi:uncharacterized protein (DUF2141 family)